MNELNPKGFEVTADVRVNLEVLLARMNEIRGVWGKPMLVTSGLRSLADHKRIYAEIAKRNGNAVIRVPMGSRHLSGQACDVADRDGSLMAWCRANVPVLERVGLWCEDGTVGWVHFQIVPPGSGKRFFKP